MLHFLVSLFSCSRYFGCFYQYLIFLYVIFLSVILLLKSSVIYRNNYTLYSKCGSKTFDLWWQPELAYESESDLWDISYLVRNYLVNSNAGKTQPLLLHFSNGSNPMDVKICLCFLDVKRSFDILRLSLFVKLSGVLTLSLFLKLLRKLDTKFVIWSFFWGCVLSL